jgi:capsular polysaccharide biosynthesis protein
MEMLNNIDVNNHPRVFIERGKTYKIKSLFYISPTTWSTVYQSDEIKSIAFGRYAKPQYVIDIYREIMLNKEPLSNTELPKKLFITRGSDKVKRLVNEQELCECSIKYGFIPYDPATDSIDMQIKYFSNSDYIVGASGAAFVNLM